MNSRISWTFLLASLISFATLVGCGDPMKDFLSQRFEQVEEAIAPSDADLYPDREINGDFPPLKGQSYPDSRLIDQDGQPLVIEDFRGEVVLVELAAIPCGGCQAFAGANDKGGYLTSKVQSNLKSIHHYVERFAKVELGRDVVFVQMLIYNNDMKAPTQEEVAGWAEHFGMKTENRHYVVGAPGSILSQETRDAIPGFHLIDHRGNLVGDSCGHQPVDNLFEDLLPKLSKLARREKRVRNRFFGKN